jgi:hypothetical protein
VTIDEARQRCKDLEAKLSGREGKYNRSLNRYMNNGARRESLWNPNVSPQAYVSAAQGAEGTQTQINVIKSAVDTIASKISQANVRPYFIPSDGDYDTDKACKKLQDYFDIWLDEQHAYPKSVMCFRDAAVYDVGVMHVDAESQSISRVPPWEYFIDPGEYNQGAVTEVAWKRSFYPLAALRERLTNKKLKKLLSEKSNRQGDFHTYWDLYGGQKFEFYGGDWECVGTPVDLDYEKYGGLYRRPFVEMFYTKPMKGFFSVSLADDLYPLQRQIDEMVKRLDAATRNAILQMILVPKGSGLKASTLENNVRAYDFTPGPDGGAPISIAPPAINQQFIELLQMYITQAYAIAGVSQLSAQSKKPADLESGRALETMEDIESDRFNVQLQQFTHFLVDLSRVAIDVFPKSKQILEKNPGMARKQKDKVTWGDVCKQRDIFSIQFSAASSLSKDPNERFAQIQMLNGMGLIDKPMMKQFAQLPDLQGIYTMINSSYDYSQKIIDIAVKTGNIEYQETVDFVELQDLTIKKINMMEAAGDKKEYIDNAVKLLRKVNAQIKAVAPIVSPPPVPVPEPIRDDGLESGQIQTLMGIIAQVNAGALTAQQGAAVIAASFPKLPPELLKGMLPTPPTGPMGPQSQPMTPPPGAAPQGVSNAA